MKETCSRPIICFYIGYTPDFISSTNGVYGAELALKSLAEELSLTHSVYIFGKCISDIKVGNIQFFNSNSLNQFMISHTVDVMIVSRYIHYFIEFHVKAVKTYIWFHDVLAQPSWNGMFLPDNAKFLLQNVIHHIDGIVVLTEWHRNIVRQYYSDIDPSKIFIIGNAIDVSRYDKKVVRVKNRFIYTSNPVRGLKYLVDNFASIRSEIPDAELFVYRGEEDFGDENQTLLDTIKSTEYIKFMGRVENESLVEHQLKADFWYYPTAWAETFCISALEAMAAGCICITSDLAALKDTIGDRGVLLRENIYSDEYSKEAIEKIIEFSKDEELKETFRNKGVEWAKNQSWPTRVNEWLNMIGYERIQHNITVKLMCNWTDHKTLFGIYKRFCEPGGRWGDVIFTDNEKADFYCIINFPRSDEYWEIEKSILLSMEELENRKTYFPNEWIIPKRDHFFNYFFKRNSIEWHLDKTYSELLTMKIEKTKVLSSVTSSEYRLPGHVKRINMISHFVQENLDFDLYGRNNKFNFKNYIGSLPDYTKDAGIFPYKYTIACENACVDNYFTEKIVDAILGECLCFYYGCPNISSHIDDRAYILINADDPEGSLQIIKDSIDNGEWEKRIDIIKQEKMKILNKLQLIPIIESIVTGKIETTNFQQECSIRVINLEMRKDRWDTFVDHAADIDFKNYTRFDATHGKSLILDDEMMTIFRIEDGFVGKRWPKLTHNFFAGVLGCAMSHMRMWKEVSNSNNDFIVLEDDVQMDTDFNKKFNNIYSDIKDDPRWDILYLGFIDDEYGQILYGDTFIYDGVMQFSKVMRTFGGGTHGYLIRPKGAIKLLQLVKQFGIKQPIDHFMIDHFDTLCVYKTVPHLVTAKICGINGTDTDIQNCTTVIAH
jgi:glycosyltransferase involved in cell wall biosynthesis/GR25 family glycosyltransferase involved in LPS biosynthesis